MDNGVTKQRDMKEPKKEVNSRISVFWPVILVFSILYLLVIIHITKVKRVIVALFKEKKSVKGKLVLITGAGRGLGRRTALELSKLGARIACVDVHVKNNEETVKLIRSQGGVAESFTCNIAKSGQVEKLKQDVSAKLGTVDILINNAALLMAIRLREMSYEDIRGIYEVNIMGHVFMTKAFLPEMMDRNSGHIVVMSSLAAASSLPYLSLYSSTKAALTRYFECARNELDMNPENEVKVTIVHPFFINTSEDYIKWFQLFVPIMEEDYVVGRIIDAMLYDKECIFVPSIFSLSPLIDALTAPFQYNIITKVLAGKSIALPSKEDRQEIPYGAIISDISNTAK